MRHPMSIRGHVPLGRLLHGGLSSSCEPVWREELTETRECLVDGLQRIFYSFVHSFAYPFPIAVSPFPPAGADMGICCCCCIAIAAAIMGCSPAAAIACAICPCAAAVAAALDIGGAKALLFVCSG